LERLRAAGVVLTWRDGRLYATSRGDELPSIARRLLEEAGATLAAEISTSIQLERDTRSCERAAPVAPSQERIVGGDRELTLLSSVVPLHAYRVVGHLDHAALERSVRAAIRRQAALRTVFRLPTAQRGAVQLVLADLPWDLIVVDLRATPVPHRAARDILRSMSPCFMDLERGPLFRFLLFQTAPDVHVLAVGLHHAINDGWSGSVLFQDIGALFEAEVRDREPELDPLPTSYAELSRAAQSARQSPHYVARLEQYVQALVGALRPNEQREGPHIPIATEVVRSAIELADPLPERVRRLARQLSTTDTAPLLAAFALLLAATSGHSDVTTAVMTPNRVAAAERDLIGFFANPVVLPLTVDPTDTGHALVRHAHARLVQALSRQDLHIQDVHRRLVQLGVLDHGEPFFQGMFVVNDFPDIVTPSLFGTTTAELSGKSTVRQFQLTTQTLLLQLDRTPRTWSGQLASQVQVAAACEIPLDRLFLELVHTLSRAGNLTTSELIEMASRGDSAGLSGLASPASTREA
jgi:hypothetical protein